MAIGVVESLKDVYSLIDKGEFDESLRRLSILDDKFLNDARYQLSRIGVLSEACQGLCDEARLEECIRGSKPFRKPQLQKLNPYLHFELANANMSLFEIRRKKTEKFPIMDNSLQEAKEHLHEGIRTADEKNVMFLATLWVNYGNCLDTLGRGVEAMYAYESALKILPNYSLAMGNKAMALRNFANISGAHFVEMNKDALDMLKSVVKRRDITPFARAQFESTIKSIEDIFKNYPGALEQEFNHRPRNTKEDTIFEKAFYDFCSSNKLFLNLHIHEDECESSMLDDVSISLILSIKDKATFPKLANFLNQIKQDYATARLLLVQSQHLEKAISRIDSRTVYTDTLEYCEFSLQKGLLESAFKEAYDILDKVAGFINEYLGIGLKRVRFDAGARNHWMSIWLNEDGTMRDAIRNADSRSLYAMFDVYQDFESGYFKEFKNIRDSLTHRKLHVHILGLGDYGDAENVSEKKLKNHTLELMKLVKSVIIYLINFIFLEEEKKCEGTRGQIPSMCFPHQINSI